MNVRTALCLLAGFVTAMLVSLSCEVRDIKTNVSEIKTRCK